MAKGSTDLFRVAHKLRQCLVQAASVNGVVFGGEAPGAPKGEGDAQRAGYLKAMLEGIFSVLLSPAAAAAAAAVPARTAGAVSFEEDGAQEVLSACHALLRLLRNFSLKILLATTEGMVRSLLQALSSLSQRLLNTFHDVTAAPTGIGAGPSATAAAAAALSFFGAVPSPVSREEIVAAGSYRGRGGGGGEGGGGGGGDTADDGTDTVRWSLDAFDCIMEIWVLLLLEAQEEESKLRSDPAAAAAAAAEGVVLPALTSWFLPEVRRRGAALFAAVTRHRVSNEVSRVARGDDEYDELEDVSLEEEQLRQAACLARCVLLMFSYSIIFGSTCLWSLP